ncbi:hypothetical protein [Candidatus Atelocyanobacterium thalassae]|uniref:Glucose-inhibited division protein A n=1 Tax=cyanobacterium endosymbiont of Braarudosphaera bigelowii TaxID=1285375 RepID=A0ABM7UC04_9CHRO|nr:hypothetical protein [Candidatus Atelocyanobacterium thalassa]BDA39399.1 hypothetical protein CPARK_000023800 [cyanobacterium endosymbiont of Braarudosphaera bigelowii]
MSRLSKFFQVVSSLLIGVFLFSGSICLLAYIIFYKMSVTPNKPIFIEENSYDQIDSKTNIF